MATQSIKTIEAQIRKLQARALALREKDRKPVIAGIVRQMKAHDIAVSDIAEAYGKPRAARRAAPARPATSKAGKAGKARKAVPVKYRHPDTGDTWTGRGRTPRWIVEAEEAGADRSSFAV